MITIYYQIVLVFWFVGFTGYQDKNPDPVQIVEKTKANFKSIIDFTADVEIEINVDFINIPTKKAEVFYKYPDKFKFKGDSFIMIPKKGLGFSIFEVLENRYTAVYIGKKEMNGRILEEIKVIPLVENSRFVLATLWVDTRNFLIYQIEATTKNSGHFITDFEYGKDTPLPDINRIRFEVDEMQLPLMFSGNLDVDKAENRDNTVGEVIIRYSNYNINQGLSDDLFKEGEPKE